MIRTRTSMSGTTPLGGTTTTPGPVRAKTVPPSCKAVRVLAGAHPAWREALEDREHWSAPALWNALGRTVSATQIRYHREGNCICPPKNEGK